MLKCNIDKKKNHVQVKVSGTADTINTELLALINALYTGIRNKDKGAADIFRVSTIGALLDPESPVWKAYECPETKR